MYQSVQELVQRILLLEQYIITLEEANKNKAQELNLKQNIISQLKQEIQRLKIERQIDNFSIVKLQEEIKLNQALSKCKQLEKQNDFMKKKLTEFQKKISIGNTQTPSFLNYKNQINLGKLWNRIQQSNSCDYEKLENFGYMKNNFCYNKIFEQQQSNLENYSIQLKQSEKTLTSQTQQPVQYKVYQMCGTISFSNLNDAEIDIPINNHYQPEFIPSLTKLSYDRYQPSFLKR